MRDLINLNDAPFRMLDNIERDMKRFLKTFPIPSSTDTFEERFLPACDIVDKDSHYVMSLDVPGIPKEDINIEVSDGELRVSGERASEKKEGDYTEKSYGSFERIMTLPQGVKEEDIEASYENGVLSIAIPKTEGSTKKHGKKIPISEGKKEGVFKKLLGEKKGKTQNEKQRMNKAS